MKTASVKIECVHSYPRQTMRGQIGGKSSEASFDFDAESFLRDKSTQELILKEFYQMALLVTQGLT